MCWSHYWFKHSFYLTLQLFYQPLFTTQMLTAFIYHFTSTLFKMTMLTLYSTAHRWQQNTCPYRPNYFMYPTSSCSHILSLIQLLLPVFNDTLRYTFLSLPIQIPCWQSLTIWMFPRTLYNINRFEVFVLIFKMTKLSCILYRNIIYCIIFLS